MFWLLPPLPPDGGDDPLDDNDKGELNSCCCNDNDDVGESDARLITVEALRLFCFGDFFRFFFFFFFFFFFDVPGEFV